MEIVPINDSRKSRNTGPSCMTRTIRNGPKGNALNMNSLEVPHLQPSVCPPTSCPKCQGKKTKYIQCVYKQPARVKNFAPISTYNSPVERMEDNTVYKNSFMPLDGDRQEPILPQDNLKVPSSKFSTNTIQRMSFPGWYNQDKTKPIRPCQNNLSNKGIISDTTIQRQDYTEKNADPAIPVLPKDNLFRSDAPFTKFTVNKLSYQPTNGYEVRKPIVQTVNMVWPTGPLEQNSIQKLSFQPCKIPKKEFYPWAQKEIYTSPTTKMGGDTVYRKSYVPNENFERRVPVIHEGQKKLLSEHDGFDCNTIYKLSYPDNKGFDRQAGFLPKNNLQLSKQKMETNTTQNMSYIPNTGYTRPVPVRPFDHQLIGKGPMQGTTTTQCDFAEKQMEKLQQFKPKQQLFLSCEPLSDKTINRLSFMPPNPQDQTSLIIPTNQYQPLTGKMEDKTTQRLSYMPVGVQEPVSKPWAQIKPYCAPTHKFVEDTCYRMSYDVPGEWVNCEDGNDEPCECQCQPDDCPCACPCPSVPVC